MPGQHHVQHDGVEVAVTGQLQALEPVVGGRRRRIPRPSARGAARPSSRTSSSTSSTRTRSSLSRRTADLPRSEPGSSQRSHSPSECRMAHAHLQLPSGAALAGARWPSCSSWPAAASGRHHRGGRPQAARRGPRSSCSSTSSRRRSTGSPAPSCSEPISASRSSRGRRIAAAPTSPRWSPAPTRCGSGTPGRTSPGSRCSAPCGESDVIMNGKRRLGSGPARTRRPPTARSTPPHGSGPRTRPKRRRPICPRRPQEAAEQVLDAVEPDHRR